MGDRTPSFSPRDGRRIYLCWTSRLYFCCLYHFLRFHKISALVKGLPLTDALLGKKLDVLFPPFLKPLSIYRVDLKDFNFLRFFEGVGGSVAVFYIVLSFSPLAFHEKDNFRGFSLFGPSLLT